MAFRNITMAWRRSLFTIVIVSISIFSILMMEGYLEYIRQGLAETLIRNEYSHFQIYPKGFTHSNDEQNTSIFIDRSTVDELEELLLSYEEVDFVLPRIQFNGLIGTSENSRFFLGVAGVPEFENIMATSTRLSYSNDDSIFIAEGLKSILNIDSGDDLVISVPTTGGGIEASIGIVENFAEVGPKALNNSLVQLPLSMAQSLFYTDGAQRLLVMLFDTEDLIEMYSRFIQDTAGLDIETRLWNEIDTYFEQVIVYQSGQFNILTYIMLFVAFMVIVNTSLMSINGRKQEIATLRAIGISRLEVSYTILVESFILSIIGAIVGLMFSLFVSLVLNSVIPIYIPPPPGTTEEVQVGFIIQSVFVATSFLYIILVSITATVIPGYQAANANIADTMRSV